MRASRHGRSKLEALVPRGHGITAPRPQFSLVKSRYRIQALLRMPGSLPRPTVVKWTRPERSTDVSPVARWLSPHGTPAVFNLRRIPPGVEDTIAVLYAIRHSLGGARLDRFDAIAVQAFVS
jgi:hypothetical protein